MQKPTTPSQHLHHFSLDRLGEFSTLSLVIGCQGWKTQALHFSDDECETTWVAKRGPSAIVRGPGQD
jgi:hypothetical protein